MIWKKMESYNDEKTLRFLDGFNWRYDQDLAKEKIFEAETTICSIKGSMIPMGNKGFLSRKKFITCPADLSQINIFEENSLHRG